MQPTASHLILLLAATSILWTASAQSPLTTTYAGGNGLGSGSTIYFDLVVNAPVLITALDVNLSSAVGTPGTIDVRFTPNTYVGNATNAAAWTLGGSGAVTAAGSGQPSTCQLSPFTLPPGNYGIGITFNGVGQSYSNGNGTVTPGSGTNQTYATAELQLLAGASAGGAPGVAICCEPRVFNGSIYYLVTGSGTVAQRTPYGTGCYRRYASFYQYWASSSAFTLANSSITWLPAGSGYFVIGGVGNYVTPSATAAVLNLPDDGQVIQPISAPFSYPGGSTSSLVVCSNGFVSMANGNGTTYTPVVATMLNAPQTAFWNWHDYNPAIASGGRVKFEQISGVAYVTWDGVWDFGGTTAANANTFQFQFDLATGIVHMVCQTMSALGNPRLVGYSPGGPSLDPGNSNLAAALSSGFLVYDADRQPLALTASARPVLGTAINLVTSNTVAANLGLLFFGLASIPAPGLDLGAVGAAGCPALLDPSFAVGNLIGNLPGTSLSIPLGIPNLPALVGALFYAQSLWLDPGANGAGFLTSNGVELLLGNI